jgi:hypothetical protein
MPKGHKLQQSPTMNYLSFFWTFCQRSTLSNKIDSYIAGFCSYPSTNFVPCGQHCRPYRTLVSAFLVCCAPILARINRMLYVDSRCTLGGNIRRVTTVYISSCSRQHLNKRQNLVL